MEKVECEICGYDEVQEIISQCEKCYKYFCNLCSNVDNELICSHCDDD